VASVQFLQGDALWRAAQERRWSLPLAEAAMATEFGKNVPDLRRFREGEKSEPHGLLLTYRDGFKATVLKLGRSSVRWNFAVKPAGAAARATRFQVGPWGNRNLFMALAHAIQDHFARGRSPYPVERTLLTTGVTEAAMRSRHQGGALVQTPQLHLAYEARDFSALREDGASWKVMPPGTPETKGISPIGDR
jgi:hypothetical protein